MRKSRYSDSRIMAILKPNDQGVAIPGFGREHSISQALHNMEFYSIQQHAPI